MQSTQDKQVNDVLYLECLKPQRLVWQYQTAESRAVWIDSDGCDLMFKHIPSGKVTAYRLKAMLRASCGCDGESRCSQHGGI